MSELDGLQPVKDPTQALREVARERVAEISGQVDMIDEAWVTLWQDRTDLGLEADALKEALGQRVLNYQRERVVETHVEEANAGSPLPNGFVVGVVQKLMEETRTLQTAARKERQETAEPETADLATQAATERLVAIRDQIDMIDETWVTLWAERTGLELEAELLMDFLGENIFNYVRREEVLTHVQDVNEASQLPNGFVIGVARDLTKKIQNLQELARNARRDALQTEAAGLAVQAVLRQNSTAA